MKQENNSGISFFQRYLTVWVATCMVLGVLIGKYLPGIPAFLNRFEYARVSIPMRYTGLAQVTNWVKLKLAAMNLKKFAIRKWVNTHIRLQILIFWP